MAATLLARAARGTLAITPLTREKFAAWRDAQDSPGRNWVAGQGFTGAEGQICVLPDNEGRPSAVAFGLDEAAPFWSYAALPANLPAGSYRLAPPLAPPRAEIAALGWLVGSYRFERYRQGPGKDFPRLVKPANADRARVEVTSVLARNDSAVRRLENLPREVTQIAGCTPARIEVAEGSLRPSVDPWQGQKTGAFLDQRENRRRVAELGAERMLDVFCYQGGFALDAAAGSAEAIGIDSSAPAVEQCRANAERNGLDGARFVRAAAFDWKEHHVRWKLVGYVQLGAELEQL